MNPIDTRLLALNLLVSIEKKEAYSHILLNRTFEDNKDLSYKDRAFIKRLCEGCLERKLLLDHFASGYSKTPLNKQKPIIRVIIRMGIYQIFYMDSVPDYTAVDESVKLAKRKGLKNLSGFVNGVLRSIVRDKEGLSQKEKELSMNEDIESLSLYYSIPSWIIEMWIRDYPEVDIKAMLRALRTPRPVCIRFLKSLGEDEKAYVINEILSKNARVIKGDKTSDSLEISGLQQIGELSSFKNGLITIQDESSRLSIEGAGIKKGDSVLDVCAAPGGKSVLASELTGSEGKVLAMDISPGKLPLIQENAGRMNRSNISIRLQDASVYNEELKESFHVVICDVPCSGLGVISRKKDICYRVMPEDITELSKLAEKIVKTSVMYLKKGGRLLYSTCTISKKENLYMTELIQRDTTLKLIREKQFFPHIHNTDGFYMSVFVKE